MLKKIPVGVSDFKKIIQENYYYVDKSLLIKELIDDGSAVVLLPRPRRFGKTLNLSMIKYFFDLNEKDNLFEGLNIWQYDYCRDAHQKYPVVFISFKDVKVDNFDGCMQGIKRAIADEFRRFDYLMDQDTLSKDQKREFRSILDKSADEETFSSSLKILSSHLEQHHRQKVIILIDEYDAPIHSGYTHHYFDRIIAFMRNFFSGGFKDNTSLYKGVITGILRVAKESVFSGLNNLLVATLLDEPYSQYFGLLEDEVIEMLKSFNNASSIDTVRDWYNGYQFGNTTVYNPWSIINFVHRKDSLPMPYWVNTSSNDIIRELISGSPPSVKQEFESLLSGLSIRKQINPEIVMRDLDKVEDAIWSFLLFSGYLKQSNMGSSSDGIFCDLRIPNAEVSYLFKNIVHNWFKESIQSNKFELMLQSLVSGDIKTFGRVLRDFVFNSFSYLDKTNREPERVYHAFVLGLLIALHDKYQVKSNRESGYGRYDVMLIPRKKNLPGIIFEFKTVYTQDGETLETSVDEALDQIEEKQYRQELFDIGVPNITEIGVAFLGKDILLKWREIKKNVF